MEMGQRLGPLDFGTGTVERVSADRSVEAITAVAGCLATDPVLSVALLGASLHNWHRLMGALYAWDQVIGDPGFPPSR